MADTSYYRNKIYNEQQKIGNLNKAEQYANTVVSNLNTAISNLNTTKSDLEKYFKINGTAADGGRISSIIAKINSDINKIKSDVIPYIKREKNTCNSNINYYNSEMKKME